MKIVQFGLHHSPNVGDGIISECILYALRNRHPEAELSTIDLAGRKQAADVTVQKRALIVKILNRLPSSVRRLIVATGIKRIMKRVDSDWRASFAGADLAILGGGQIFSDADLNFCLKIAKAAEIIRDDRVPCCIYAVGVARNWSGKGQQLFEEVFTTDLRFIGIRDNESIASWSAQTTQRPDTPKPTLTRDPGLLTAECFGHFDLANNGRIGLGVASPEILSYHSDDKSGQQNGTTDLVAQIALKLLETGHAVSLFCNGAAEDVDAMKELTEHPSLQQFLASGQLIALDPPRVPSDLARSIAPLSLVIAHRLHACIVSYAYGHPIVGLGWDSKVESFFKSVGLDDAFVSKADMTAEHVAQVAQSALQTGIDTSKHKAVLTETWDGIDAMLGSATR